MAKTMTKKTMEVIVKEAAKVTNAPFSTRNKLTHIVVNAVGQGTEFPILSSAVAVTDKGAVMLRIETALPTPIFIVFNNNYLRKNTPEEVEKTNKRYTVDKKLSNNDYGSLLNLYEKTVPKYGIEIAEKVASTTTGYLFTGELLKSFLFTEEKLGQNLRELGEKAKNILASTTSVDELPEIEKEIAEMLTPEGVTTDEIIQITKWEPLSVPEGATTPVYSTGVFKRAHWDSFNLSIFEPYERKNAFWKSTYTNLDNQAEVQQTEAAKMNKAIKEMKETLKIK